MTEAKLNDKEREAKLKALRRELAAEIEEDLAENLPGFPGGSLREGEGTDSGAEISMKRILEALLFATGKPITVPEIRKMLQGVGAALCGRPDTIEDRDTNSGPGQIQASGQPRGASFTAKEIERLLAELREEYQKEKRSFELIEIAGGWEMATKKHYAPWVARLENQRKVRQATRSALETLAVLAYKQPVTRAEIEEIRGVDVSAVLATLLERNFIKIVGRKEVPGRPFLYGTTEKFLEHFGLKSISGLPDIAEIKNLVERAVRKEELIQTRHSEPVPLQSSGTGEESRAGDPSPSTSTPSTSRAQDDGNRPA